MRPPPIRYPLPTLAALILLGLLLWRGAAWTSAWRSALAERWGRALAGPPVPASDTPQAGPGGIPRRVLLLREETPASGLPDGPPAETIRLRVLARVYDTWPLSGEPTHYRVGTSRPIGWVPASAVLPWDTRLALRPASGRLALASSPGGPPAEVEVGPAPVPVIGWTDTTAEVALWEPESAWSAVARTGWVRLDAVEPGDWAAWLSRDELLAILGGESGRPPLEVRLRAVLGRLAGEGAVSDAERDALPGPVASIPAPDPAASADALSRINERWTADASWSGLSFRAIPLADLP